ncbi:hypothetical protein BURMUCGD1_0282 [Burkholderia multivorans CGD1]|nr:hypothetical protein BURMUCGD1_0282 [Burkholderia multivorans CGD1]
MLAAVRRRSGHLRAMMPLLSRFRHELFFVRRRGAGDGFCAAAIESTQRPRRLARPRFAPT